MLDSVRKCAKLVRTLVFSRARGSVFLLQKNSRPLFSQSGTSNYEKPANRRAADGYYLLAAQTESNSLATRDFLGRVTPRTTSDQLGPTLIGSLQFALVFPLFTELFTTSLDVEL